MGAHRDMIGCRCAKVSMRNRSRQYLVVAMYLRRPSFPVWQEQPHEVVSTLESHGRFGHTRGGFLRFFWIEIFPLREQL
jgi:hypothetical protein